MKDAHLAWIPWLIVLAGTTMIAAIAAVILYSLYL